MSVTLYLSQVLTKDDLNIFLYDNNGNLFNPFAITYTIYRIILPTPFYNQECAEEPLLETLDTTAIPFGLGQYFAAWSMPIDITIGKYRIKWSIRQFADSPIYQEIEEFDIINKADKLNYSAMNQNGNQILPAQAYGNENLCAG
jgi:hypothetical protein